MEQFLANLKIALIKYFDKNGTISLLQENAKEFCKRYSRGEIDVFSGFYSPMFINLIEFNEESGFACDFLLKEPELVQQAVTELALAALNLILEDPKSLQINQIRTDIILPPVLDPKQFPYFGPGLCNTTAKILQQTLPKKTICLSRWKCNQSICTTMNPTVCKYLPKTKPICPHCSTQLEELPTSREYSTQSQLILQIANSQILAYLAEERSFDKEICLGDEVAVTGINRESGLEVWGLQRFEFHAAPPVNGITGLKRQLEGSAWGFVRALAGCLGAAILPEGAYMHLRIGLLLSLASTSFRPIPILAIAEDSQVAEALMREAAELSQNCVRPTFETNLGGQINDEWMKAGSLLLAARGVCYLGLWQPYLGKKGEIVRNSVESGRVSLEGGRGIYVDLKAAVWTCWDKPTMKKNENQMETLLKVFGLAWRAEDDLSTDEAVTDYIKRDRSPLIPLTELKAYLDYIKPKYVHLSEGATNLLKQYFVCARKSRGGMLPLTSLDPLRALTEAHARLNDRNVAFPEDALAAIELCERALGPCVGLPRAPDEIWEFGDWLRRHVLDDEVDCSQLTQTQQH